jgi:hypothetical protein
MVVQGEQLAMATYLKKFGEPRDADFISRMLKFEASQAQMKYLRDLFHNARIVHDPKYNPPKPQSKNQEKVFSMTPEEEQAQYEKERDLGMHDGPENAAMMKILMECMARAEAGQRRYLKEFKEFAKFLTKLYKENASNEVRRKAKHEFVVSMAQVLGIPVKRGVAENQQQAYSEGECPEQTK